MWRRKSAPEAYSSFPAEKEETPEPVVPRRPVCRYSLESSFTCASTPSASAASLGNVSYYTCLHPLKYIFVGSMLFFAFLLIVQACFGRAFLVPPQLIVFFWFFAFLLGFGVSTSFEVGRSTAGLLFLETHTNNQFGKQPEGLQHFRDHRWKALGEENPDLSGLFFFRHYFESYIE